jgi:O-antigen ligase
MIWLLGGYMWLFIHRPFEVWPWLGTFHIERIYMLLTVVCWLFSGRIRWISNRLNVAFALLVASVLASAIFGALAPCLVDAEDWLKITVFYVLVTTTVRGKEDLKRLLVIFLVVFGLYMMHSTREYICGRGHYAMGTWRMVAVDVTLGDPNSFAGSMVCALPLLYPVWFLATRRWHRLLLMVYLCLSIACVLLTGSRMGFAGLCALVLGAILLSRHRVKYLFFLAVCSPLIWMMLPEDRQNRFLTLIDPTKGPKSAQESAEGRTHGFINGLKLWRENPLFGVGPGQTGKSTGEGTQAHNLYGQVLGELGTFGAAAFLMVIVSYVKNWWEIRKLIRAAPSTNPFLNALSDAIMAAILLLLLMGWGGHNLFRYTWLWYGAFQAIALQCLLRQDDELVNPSPQPVFDGSVEGAYS